MDRLLAEFLVDTEKLLESSGMESKGDAIKAEFGWLEQSGIDNNDWVLINDSELNNVSLRHIVCDAKYQAVGYRPLNKRVYVVAKNVNGTLCAIESDNINLPFKNPDNVCVLNGASEVLFATLDGVLVDSSNYNNLGELIAYLSEKI